MEFGGPRARIAYLLGVAVAAFAISRPLVVGALAVLQLILWFAARLPLRALGRILRKLSVFLLVLIVCLGLSGLGEGEAERWVRLPLGLALSLSAVALGALMALRILTVVMASALIQRTGAPDVIARGLRGIGVPEIVALTVDETLSSLQPETAGAPSEARRGGGGGHGMGGGRGRGRHREVRTAQTAAVRAGAALLDPIVRRLAESRRRLAQKHPGLPPTLAHDVPIIASIGTVMMGFKLVKVLPGLPFAPGFKGAVLLPPYVLTREVTRSRAGSTVLGTTFGLVSFLLGDGRFGIFEVVKHTAPGVMVDLTYPWLRPLLLRSTAACCLYGAVLGGTRLSGELAVAWLVGAPGLFYAYLGFAALTHLAGGFISGFATAPLLRSADRIRAVREEDTGHEEALTPLSAGSGGLVS